MAKQNLGMVTAYAYAVVGGYEGTEAEFEALLGNISTDLAEIENLTVIANTLPPGSSATASYDHGVLTLGIPKGDKGDTGAGATVTAGTTATGNPGTNASVTNIGTTKDAVFNFTIPRGDTGNGIESIYLTGTSGAVKTYTILFTDGNTTTFDVTDGEVTNATLTAVLADYAKIDGAYESMTVGNAEQLVSTVFVNDEEPYNFRTSGGSADIGDRLYDTIVGGTVGWNQLVQNGNFADTSAWSGAGYGDITVSGNVGTLTLTDTGNSARIEQSLTPVRGHKYFCSATHHTPYVSNHTLTFYSTGSNYIARTFSAPANTWVTTAGIKNVSNDENISGYIRLYCGSASSQVGDAIKFRNAMLVDLTAMFGSTIADYIYSLETANAGAGVAWFKKLFPKPYYAYNAGELMSVNTSAHNTVGFNAWDEQWKVGEYDNTGQKVSGSGVRCKTHIPVLPNTAYYLLSPNILYVCFYDADKNFISRNTYGGNTVRTTPNNAYYMTFNTASAYGTTYKNDICINLSWDGERDGEYEAYEKHSYPLDNDLVLRGIPKLDASNNLYYDGDVYEPDGSVTRKYGEMTFDGSADESIVLQTQYNGSSSVHAVFRVDVPNMAITIYGDANGLFPYGDYKAQVVPDATVNDNWTIRKRTSNSQVFIFAPSSLGEMTVEDFKTHLSKSKLMFLYELATPTTETADPYTNPQIVNDFGTEEYVDYAMSEGDRDVAIPVGHITKYTNNLRAKLEMSPNSPDGAGDYLVRQTNGINEYVSLSSNATIQDMLARIEALEGGGE